MNNLKKNNSFFNPISKDKKKNIYGGSIPLSLVSAILVSSELANSAISHYQEHKNYQNFIKESREIALFKKNKIFDIEKNKNNILIFN